MSTWGSCLSIPFSVTGSVTAAVGNVQIAKS